MAPRVVIAGGGLAGLVSGLALARAGFEVEIYEQSDQLGGKARADNQLQDFPYPIEHGYHIFPGWYKNVRQIMASTHSLDNLTDLNSVYYVPPPNGQGQVSDFFELRQGYENRSELLKNFLNNVFHGPAPWYNMLQGYYFILDLLIHPDGQRRVLDRISLNGFLFSRWYTTGGLEDFGQESVLQASAIPAYEVSAMTIKKLLRLWTRYSTPWLSVLKTDLQKGFIDPLVAEVRAAGCRIKRKHPVTGLFVDNGMVSGLRVSDGKSEGVVPADYTIIAVPLEVARGWHDGLVQIATNKLVGLKRLESRPMASMHIAFDRKIPNIPRGHVLLMKSKYSLSFIDNSQIWSNLQDSAQEGRTFISLISSDFLELENLPEFHQISSLLKELIRYVPSLDCNHISDVAIRSNSDAPLYINTVGSWPFGPAQAVAPSAQNGVGTEQYLADRLYLAGDYAQNDADLTCMEGAVQSALNVAAAIAQLEGHEPAIQPIPLQPYSKRLVILYRLAKLGCFPGALISKIVDS